MCSWSWWLLSPQMKLWVGIIHDIDGRSERERRLPWRHSSLTLTLLFRGDRFLFHQVTQPFQLLFLARGQSSPTVVRCRIEWALVLVCFQVWFWEFLSFFPLQMRNQEFELESIWSKKKNVHTNKISETYHISTLPANPTSRHKNRYFQVVNRESQNAKFSTASRQTDKWHLIQFNPIFPSLLPVGLPRLCAPQSLCVNVETSLEPKGEGRGRHSAFLGARDPLRYPIVAILYFPRSHQPAYYRCPCLVHSTRPLLANRSNCVSVLPGSVRRVGRWDGGHWDEWYSVM